MNFFEFMRDDTFHLELSLNSKAGYIPLVKVEFWKREMKMRFHKFEKIE